MGGMTTTQRDEPFPEPPSTLHDGDRLIGVTFDSEHGAYVNDEVEHVTHRHDDMGIEHYRVHLRDLGETLDLTGGARVTVRHRGTA
jgi:hypothetical protein